MSRVSSKNFFERHPTGVLQADQPMDAGYCWTLVDNIGHLVDERSQYRVNWLRHRDMEEDDVLVLPGEVFFPTQLIYGDRYPRYDIRVATIADDVYTVRASIVGVSIPPPILGLGVGVVATVVGTTSNSTPDAEWAIDAIADVGTRERAPYPFVSAPSTSATIGTGPHVLVKLLIEAGGPVDIVGVQVREFTE